MLLEVNSAPTGRKAPRPVRRQQLIDATILILAAKGFSALTVADVAKSAGLSVGIINFHFESKDKLLSACLAYLSDEYHRNWKRAFTTPNATLAEKLQLVLLSDFEDHIFTREKHAAWIAFWGETQGRPTYEQICAMQNAEHATVVENLCSALIKDGNYGLDAQSTMRIFEALTDGLWLGNVPGKAVAGISGSAIQARTAVLNTLAGFFPKHYPL
jgi:AcrR family transcriptional regulator